MALKTNYTTGEVLNASDVNAITTKVNGITENTYTKQDTDEFLSGGADSLPVNTILETMSEENPFGEKWLKCDGSEYDKNDYQLLIHPSSWTAMSGLVSAAYYGVTYGNGRFVCVGASGRSYYSTDGVTWTAMSGLASATYYSVTYGNGRFVCVGDSGKSYYKQGSEVRVIPTEENSFIKALV